MLESLKQKQEQKKLEQEKQMQEAAQRRQEEQKLLEEIAYAQAELNALKKEHGIEDKEKGIKRLISYLLDKRDAREKTLISKKKYLSAEQMAFRDFILGTELSGDKEE